MTNTQPNTPPTMPDPQPVDLTPLAPLVDNALMDASPMLVAYVTPDGQPSISYRGSVQVHGPNQLQAWIRKPEGGLIDGIAANPKVAIWYRKERTMLNIKGRARVVDDEGLRKQIYDTTPEHERNADAECKGRAILIDVESVMGRGADGPVVMRD